jgi:serine/threonine protein kinase
MNTIQLAGDRTPVWDSAPAAALEPERLGSGLGIGRYRMERVLGEGTYGRVHLARQNVLERKVAVKILHRRHGSKKEEIRAFLNEALILADLNHPGIVPVYDAGWTDDGFFYIVSRFVEGGDLGALLARHRLLPDESARIVAAIAEALGYAHSRGLVHRDIKPANILIDPPGKPLLTDFGVALRDQDFGRGSGLVGTPPYMSPEQARGEGNRVDGRSDIFSLGIVLYELLTGVRPFGGETQRELLDQIIRAEVRSPCETDASVPEALGRVCLRALARRASERYSTCDEMASALRDGLWGPSGRQTSGGLAVRGEGVSVSPVMPSTRRAPKTSTISDEAIGDSHVGTIIHRGLHPYEAADAPFFLPMLPGARTALGLPESIEFWKCQIERKSREECFRVGLLFGLAGSGKTSLVRAGLLPSLSARVSTVHITATADGTEARLRNRLQIQCPDLAGETGLAAMLIAARKGAALPSGGKLLIVVDQFERWLRANRAGDAKGLAAAFRQCDGEHLQALLLARDDCWSGASRFMRDVGCRIVEGENAAAVDPLDHRHARMILAAIGRAIGKLPEGETHFTDDQEMFLDRAISRAGEDGQILPIRLALLADVVKRQTWNEQSVSQLLPTKDIASAFLDEAFRATSAPPEFAVHAQAARLVLKRLLPPSGRNGAAPGPSYGDLLTESGYASRPFQFEALMQILTEELRLVSRQASMTPIGVDCDQWPDGQHHYEITNDYMVEHIRKWLSRKNSTKRDRIGPARSESRVPGQFDRINVNVATEDELTRLPGIGIAMARRLVSERPYFTFDDLLRVRGIAAKHLEDLRPLIKLD